MIGIAIGMQLNYLLMSSSMGVFAMSKHPPSPIPPAPTPSFTVTPEPSTVPNLAPHMSVGTITGASPAEFSMIASGLSLANQKLSSACYKQWILAAHYTENNGLTQQQIWDLMVKQPISVDVEMYTGDWRANHVSKTIGYENDPYDGVVHMNRYFVNSAYMVADNLVHEGEGHSQGFHHYGTFSTSDPYGQNYAFEGCSNQQMQKRGAKPYKPPGIKIEIRKKASK